MVLYLYNLDIYYGLKSAVHSLRKESKCIPSKSASKKKSVWIVWVVLCSIPSTCALFYLFLQLFKRERVGIIASIVLIKKLLLTE